jgi:hypothetical protein
MFDRCEIPVDGILEGCVLLCVLAREGAVELPFREVPRLLLELSSFGVFV